MRSGVTIRSADPSDFEPLCKLYRDSIKGNPHGFIQDLTFHGCLTDKIAAWRGAGGDFLVASFGDRLVGLGGLAPQNSRSAELCKLHVGSEWQGRGIGRRIATELVERARRIGFSEVHLHVTATQTVAIVLYRSLGFRETGRKLFTATVLGAPASFDTIYMNLAL
jgi:ribosomal protein S18 acetylase RimI-like enzyme